MTLTELRKWLAVGSGIGIEIRGSDLHVIVVKVRPSGVRLVGALAIKDFRARPASDWGGEYSAVMKKLGAAHLAATVMLPRGEMIVRQLNLPGVADKDLQAAVSYQIDALHPYAEEDAIWTAARIGRTSSVLVGITRRDTLDGYMNMFTEAGIKVASFTFSAAVIYSALRIYTVPAAAGFLALHSNDTGVEAYGESESRPIFSAAFNGNSDRAQALASAELRLPAEIQPVRLVDVLPYPKGASREDQEYEGALAERILPYATAVAGACPRLGLPINLLPENQRRSGSRLIYVPTIILLTVLGVLLAAWGLEGPYNKQKYVGVMEAEIKKLEPQVSRLAAVDKGIEDAGKRTKLLDDFRKRSREDMDALNEVTRVLAPPAWANSIEITRNSVNIAGEAEQAAPLIKAFDSSKLFENSEFTMPLARIAGGEAFRIRTQRRGAAKEGGAQ
jgi:hypothetical protein